MTLKSSTGYFVQSNRMKAWIEQNNDFLNSLEKVETEQLVFALKNASQDSHHEQGMDGFVEFNEKLEALNISKDLLEIQKKALGKFLKAIGVSAFMGVVLSLSIGLFVTSEWGFSLLLLVLATYLFYKAFKLGEAAEILHKEQDRRYLFGSIRMAKTAEELAWAGLFAYNSKSQISSRGRSDFEIEQEELEIKRLRQELRDSLYRDTYGPFV